MDDAKKEFLGDSLEYDSHEDSESFLSYSKKVQSDFEAVEGKKDVLEIFSDDSLEIYGK